MSILGSQAKQNLITMLKALEDDGADHNDTQRQSLLLLLIDNDVWTLEEYLAWMAADDDKRRAKGQWVGGLTQNLDHWAEYGITKASELGAYLDAECAKEQRKSAY